MNVDYNKNLKLHSRTEENVLSLPDSEFIEELKARYAAKLKREERRQGILEIARKHDIPIEYYADFNTTSSEITNLEDVLLKDNQIYTEKIELGMRVVMIIHKGVVREKSLAREFSFTETKNQRL